jgi:hypothetical protein
VRFYPAQHGQLAQLHVQRIMPANGPMKTRLATIVTPNRLAFGHPFRYRNYTTV